MMKATVMCAAVLGLATQASAFGGDESMNMDDGTVMSVINGQTKGAAEAPWFAVMIEGTDGMRNMCGGAQIAEGWIITAAHCTGFDSAHVEHMGDQWHIGPHAVNTSGAWYEQGWDGARMEPVITFGDKGWFVHEEYQWSHPNHVGADPIHDQKDWYDCGPALGDFGWSNGTGFHDFGGDCEQWDMALVRVAPIDSYQGSGWMSAIIEIETNDVCSGEVTLWGTGRRSTNDRAQRVFVEKADLHVYTPEECFNSVWNLNFVGEGTGNDCKEDPNYFQNNPRGTAGVSTLCGNQALRNNDWLGSAICAGGKSPVDGVVRSSCNGDSGGPITQNGKLVGMVNSGNVNDCENDEPSLYFRLSMGKALQWVSDTINGNGGSISLGSMQSAGLCLGGSAVNTAAPPPPPPAPPVTEAAVEAVVEAVEAEEEVEVAVETAAGNCASAQLKDSYGDGWNGGKVTCENGDHTASGSMSPATLCGECTFYFNGNQYPTEASVECGGDVHQATGNSNTFSCGGGVPVPAPVVEAIVEAEVAAVEAVVEAEEAAEEVGVVLEATGSACGPATMKDSYGDGWNGGFMTCGGAQMTLANGASQDTEVCGECTFTFGSGQYPQEASVECGGSTHAANDGSFTCPGVSIPSAGSVDQAAIDAAAAAEAAAAASAAAAAQAAAEAVAAANAAAAQAEADAAAAAAAADAAAEAAAAQAAAAANSAAVAAAAAAAEEAAAAVAAAAAAETAAQVSQGATCDATLKDSYGDGWNGGSMTCMGTTYTIPNGNALNVSLTCGTSCSFNFSSSQYPSEASVACDNGEFSASDGDFTCGAVAAGAEAAVEAAVEAEEAAEVAIEAAVEAEEAAPNSAQAAGSSCEADSVSPGAMTGGANYGNCGYYVTKNWCNADSYYSDEQWAAANCCSCL